LSLASGDPLLKTGDPAGACSDGRLKEAGLKTVKEETALHSADRISRADLIEQLKEDLSGEYQAIISYVVYSQVLSGAEYMNIAGELEKHAAEELSNALIISKQIDYLGGMPAVLPKPVRTSEKPKEMLRFDLENEMPTIRRYR
jgi:bacterioferritin